MHHFKINGIRYRTAIGSGAQVVVGLVFLNDISVFAPSLHNQ